MTMFTKHNENTAPEASAKVLNAAKDRYGFVPNLAAYIAESPVVLESVLSLSAMFDKSSLTPQDQQVVLLTVSILNGCSYCKTAHTALAKQTGLSSTILHELSEAKSLSDTRVEALRKFTSAVVEEKGWVSQDRIKDFLAAGFSQAQVFEVVLGVGLKTITNYCNHLAGAKPNQEFLAMAG